ncbi:MAG TPA: hypothetical protein K8W18_02360 [Corynebacterium glutamicum]|nr:hypothetical protein [Corynebacterium glutamicum]
MSQRAFYLWQEAISHELNQVTEKLLPLIFRSPGLAQKRGHLKRLCLSTPPSSVHEYAPARRAGSEGNPQGIGVEVAILHVLLKITLMVTKLHNFYSDLDRFLKN